MGSVTFGVARAVRKDATGRAIASSIVKWPGSGASGILAADNGPGARWEDAGGRLPADEYGRALRQPDRSAGGADAGASAERRGDHRPVRGPLRRQRLGRRGDLRARQGSVAPHLSALAERHSLT